MLPIIISFVISAGLAFIAMGVTYAYVPLVNERLHRFVLLLAILTPPFFFAAKWKLAEPLAYGGLALLLLLVLLGAIWLQRKGMKRSEPEHNSPVPPAMAAEPAGADQPLATAPVEEPVPPAEEPLAPISENAGTKELLPPAIEDASTDEYLSPQKETAATEEPRPVRLDAKSSLAKEMPDIDEASFFSSLAEAVSPAELEEAGYRDWSVGGGQDEDLVSDLSVLLEDEQKEPVNVSDKEQGVFHQPKKKAAVLQMEALPEISLPELAVTEDERKDMLPEALIHLEELTISENQTK